MQAFLLGEHCKRILYIARKSVIKHYFVLLLYALLLPPRGCQILAEAKITITMQFRTIRVAVKGEAKVRVLPRAE